MQTDNKENQLNKDINRMVRTLNAKTLSKNRRKQNRGGHCIQAEETTGSYGCKES